MIFKAIEFAARAHSGQYRKGTQVPYIVHPLNVGRLLLEAGVSEAVAVAGILHDTLEDAGVTLAEVREIFGDEVADLVAGVSEPPKSEVAWEGRKQELVRRMAGAAPGVALVEAADKLDNLNSIAADLRRLGPEVWNRFNRPRESQHWFYSAMARALADRADPAAADLVRQLAEKVKAVFGPDPAPDQPPGKTGTAIHF
jgi:(p)ppGpp synthase/HD superfamily hydrolase